MGMGFIVLAFCEIKIPIYISLGITVFVTILALCDLLKYSSLREEHIQTKLDKVMFTLDRSLKVVSEILYWLSIPISILIPYLTSKNIPVERINDYQQFLTLYSLGLVLFVISLSKSNDN